MLLVTQNDLQRFTGNYFEPIDGLSIKLNRCIDDPGPQVCLRMLAAVA